jgi:hypothetical protein
VHARRNDYTKVAGLGQTSRYSDVGGLVEIRAEAAIDRVFYRSDVADSRLQHGVFADGRQAGRASGWLDRREAWWRTAFVTFAACGVFEYNAWA